MGFCRKTRNDFQILYLDYANYSNARTVEDFCILVHYSVDSNNYKLLQIYIGLYRTYSIGEKIQQLKLLYTFGFGYVWILHDVGNDKEFIKLFKKRIIDCYKQNWYANISDTPKSLHYRHFK